MRLLTAICLVWASLGPPLSGDDAASRVDSDSRKTIGYFALSGQVYRLRVEGEKLFVRRWPLEESLNEWSALAPGAEGEIDHVAVLDLDRIEVQLSSSVSGVQIWEIALRERGSVIRPQLVWSGKLPVGDAPWAIYHVQENIHVATNGSMIAAIERGVVRTVDSRIYSTDGGVVRGSFAAATGHGLTVWQVVEDQLRLAAARDYNLNVVQVAALKDGGWVMLTTRQSFVQLLAVDSSLLPRWIVPIPSGVAWDLHEIAGAIVVAAPGEADAWLISGGECQRFQWTKTTALAEVVPSDRPDFMRFTDGVILGEPQARRHIDVRLVTGLWAGSRWLVVSVGERQTAIAIAAVVLLLLGGGMVAWVARRARSKRGRLGG